MLTRPGYRQLTLSDDPKTQIVQRSLWEVMPHIWQSPNTRPAPNPVLRGSLFGLVKRGEAETLKNFCVFEGKDLSVYYDGVSLGQADMDVWLRLVQMVGQRFLDPATRTVTVEFRPSLFLREIGREGGSHGRIGSHDREWLVQALKRLTGVITIRTTDNRKGIMGGLIKSAAWNDDADRLVVEIDNTVGYLFTGGYSQINLDARKSLMGDDLALWLQAFIASHKGPKATFFYSIQTLMQRCRSKITEPRKFKYRLTEKMEKLMELKADIRGFHNWVMDGDILRVFFSEAHFEHWNYSNGGEQVCPPAETDAL